MNDRNSELLAAVLLILLIGIGLAFSSNIQAAGSTEDKPQGQLGLSPEKLQKFSVCWMVGEVASGVQQVRHEGDTLAMFRAKLPRALQGMHPDLIKKHLSIGESVYRTVDIDMSRSSVLVLYYTHCINHFEEMAAESEGGWF